MGLKDILTKKKEPLPPEIPPPYSEGRIIPLAKFLNGSELAARHEEAREQRRKWAFRYLTGKDEGAE